MAQNSAKVVKFGGSSLADAKQYFKAKSIIEKDSKRRYIVVSAPGKRYPDDIKITDLLYNCHKLKADKNAFDIEFSKVKERFDSIIKDLKLDIDLSNEYNKIVDNAKLKNSSDYIASRGEYLNALIFADYIGYDFIDSADVIKFDSNGFFDEIKTQKTLSSTLNSHKNAVIGGFYGAMPDGEIKTFSRGGSDITGSIVAVAVNAELYENWTDVSGVMTINPEIISNPLPIDKITYDELYTLSSMGAGVFHEDALAPIRNKAIPINIKNTNLPTDSGTFIVADNEESDQNRYVIGISGKKYNTTATIAIVLRKSTYTNNIIEKIIKTIQETGINILSFNYDLSKNSLFTEINKDDFEKASVTVYRNFIEQL